MTQECGRAEGTAARACSWKWVCDARGALHPTKAVHVSGATPAPYHATASEPHHATAGGAGAAHNVIATHEVRVTEHGTSCRAGCVSAGSRCDSGGSCISHAVLAHRQHRVPSVHGGQLLPQALQQLALEPASTHPTQAGIPQVRPLRQHQASASRSTLKVLSD